MTYDMMTKYSMKSNVLYIYKRKKEEDLEEKVLLKHMKGWRKNKYEEYIYDDGNY